MTATDAEARHRASPGYRYYVLAILVLVYMLNFLDRQIIGILAAPLKAEFGLSRQPVRPAGRHRLRLGLFDPGHPAGLAGRPVQPGLDHDRRPGGLVRLHRPVRRGRLVRPAVPVPHGRGRGRGGRRGPGLFPGRRLFPARTSGRAPWPASPSAFRWARRRAPWSAACWRRQYGWRTAFIVVGLLGLLLAPVLRLTVRDPKRGGTDIAAGSGGRRPVRPPRIAAAARGDRGANRVGLNASRLMLVAGAVAFVLAGLIQFGGVPVGNPLVLAFARPAGDGHRRVASGSPGAPPRCVIPEEELLAAGAGRGLVVGVRLRRGRLAAAVLHAQLRPDPAQTSWYYAGIALIGGTAGHLDGRRHRRQAGEARQGRLSADAGHRLPDLGALFILAMNSPWLIGLVLPGRRHRGAAADPGLPDLPDPDGPEPGLAGADHRGGPASGPRAHALHRLGPVPADQQPARHRRRLLLFRLDERPAGARASATRACAGPSTPAWASICWPRCC